MHTLWYPGNPTTNLEALGGYGMDTPIYATYLDVVDDESSFPPIPHCCSPRPNQWPSVHTESTNCSPALKLSLTIVDSSPLAMTYSLTIR